MKRLILSSVIARAATLILLMGFTVLDCPAAEEIEAGAEADAGAGDDSGEATVLEGHSYHGEAFNEGPRQRAFLMDGLGRVRFPVTAGDPLAAQFVAQGLAQLHGFWYFEAERSFRQAAAIDPECAMAYWGMALANKGNEKRAKGFIKEAAGRKEKVSRRERLYIESFEGFLTDDKKERKGSYARALERLCYEFPDDIEARALLALQLWDNRTKEQPISHLAVDALIGQVLAVEPLHPVHHYRIHLWDSEKPEIALTSAARCGQSLPAIAHMWHMPGHIFSKLNRYNDAAWQQEASARVDHVHMMEDRVMPDQIHNFAHNNEWLIRNLSFVGRFHDALDLAKNMIELPRHPKYNTTTRRGSSYYGRVRLLQVLSHYELWDDLIALSETPYLEPTDNEAEQVNRLRNLGRACFRSGDPDSGLAQVGLLRKRLKGIGKEREAAEAEAEAKARVKVKEAGFDEKAVEAAVKKAEERAMEEDADAEDYARARGDAERVAREEQLKEQEKEIEKAKEKAGEKFGSRTRVLEEALAEFKGYQALEEGRFEEALKLFKEAKGMDNAYLAHVRFLAGETEKALEDARKHVESHENEVQPLAMLADLEWRADRKEAAIKTFGKLREISGPIDLDSPVFQRLLPIAQEQGLPEDWRETKPPADDLGIRPTLESLGSFRWQPSPAPVWTLENHLGSPRSLTDFRGRPVLLILYLGSGCLHCAEQLQAFAPRIGDYREAGIEMMAISSDDSKGLKVSIENYDGGGLPIPLLSDGGLEVFKAYRCHDDFENQPLHGTFLIDGEGMIRWQDISFEPFMDADFLLKEAQRLLDQD